MAMKLSTLEFSENWNNKLYCKCFSTIRMHNPEKYRLGNKFQVKLKGQTRPHPAVVRAVTPFYIGNLTEGMALIDTGYSKAQAQKIIRTMYKYKVPNVDAELFDFVVLQYLDSETITDQTKLFK